MTSPREGNSVPAILTPTQISPSGNVQDMFVRKDDRNRHRFVFSRSGPTPSLY